MKHRSDMGGSGCSENVNNLNCGLLASLVLGHDFQVLPLHKERDMKQTLIFIPSYFDFIRIRNYFKKEAISFTHINE